MSTQLTESAAIAIRRATPGDATAIATLMHSLHFIRRLESEPLETTVASVEKNMVMCQADDSHSVYVACTASDEPVGYIAVHWLPYLMLPGPEGFVSELFIAEDWRGRGVGTQLLDTVHREAAERGCSRLQLINFRVRESYKREFYAKAGWTERPDAANFVLTV